MLKTGLTVVTGILLSALISTNSFAESSTIKQMPVMAIHPTQPAVGYGEILYKVARYQANPHSLFDSFCENNGAGNVQHFDTHSQITNPDSFRCQAANGTYPQAVKSAVIAPDHQVYLTDGHHTISEFRRIAGDHDFRFSVRITHDLSQLPNMAAFWQWMVQHNQTWLKDPAGNSVQPANLPQQVSMQTMQDDTYRSVLYFLRSVAYKKPKNAPPFLEFYLGDWLRHHQPATAADLKTEQGYAAYLARAASALTAADGRQHSTSSPTSPTLDQLGKMAKVDQRKLAKLSVKGGKLAVMFSEMSPSS